MKTQYTYLYAFILCAMVLFCGCAEDLVSREKTNDPLANFEYFWKTFDTRYGLFEVKGIDWQKVYLAYRPRVSARTTNEELYLIFTEMINELNDNHVNLYPTDGKLPVYPGGLLRVVDGVVTIRKVQEDFNLEVTKAYLADFSQQTPNLASGVIDNDIGYLCIKGTDSQKDAAKAMDEILGRLQSKKAVIIDVRGFYGGSDAVSQLLAGYFALERTLYMTTRKRNGPNHGDFSSVQSWYVDPSGHVSFTKPVVVLTSRFTQSAGETFTLAVNELPHVKLVGDTTAGSFSDNPTSELYNGWMFSLSVGDFRDASGKSYEGIGIEPDLAIVNRREATLNGKDLVLEQAVSMIK